MGSVDLMLVVSTEVTALRGRTDGGIASDAGDTCLLFNALFSRASPAEGKMWTMELSLKPGAVCKVLPRA
jgi:hypothetical protein